VQLAAEAFTMLDAHPSTRWALPEQRGRDHRHWLISESVRTLVNWQGHQANKTHRQDQKLSAHAADRLSLTVMVIS
jgi:hypothetical protein